MPVLQLVRLKITIDYRFEIFFFTLIKPQPGSVLPLTGHDINHFVQLTLLLTFLIHWGTFQCTYKGSQLRCCLPLQIS